MKRVNLFITNIIEAGAGFGLLPNGDSAFIPKGIVERVNAQAGTTYRAAVVPNKNADSIDRTPWFAVYVGDEVPDETNTYTSFDEPAHPRTADVDTTPMAIVERTYVEPELVPVPEPVPEPEPELPPLSEEVREFLLDGRVWSIGALFRAIYGPDATKASMPEEYTEVMTEMRKVIHEGKLHKGQVTTAGANLAGFDFFSVNRSALMPTVAGSTP